MNLALFSNEEYRITLYCFFSENIVCQSCQLAKSFFPKLPTARSATY